MLGASARPALGRGPTRTPARTATMAMPSTAGEYITEYISSGSSSSSRHWQAGPSRKVSDPTACLRLPAVGPTGVTAPQSSPWPSPAWPRATCVAGSGDLARCAALRAASTAGKPLRAYILRAAWRDTGQSLGGAGQSGRLGSVKGKGKVGYPRRNMFAYFLHSSLTIVLELLEKFDVVESARSPSKQLEINCGSKRVKKIWNKIFFPKGRNDF